VYFLYVLCMCKLLVLIIKIRQAMYVLHNIGPRSCKYYWCGKAISIAYEYHAHPVSDQTG